jgi:uncharacterized metal-binding protein
MPSGRVHDRITYGALLPAIALTWGTTHRWPATVAVALGTLFGGLMFGPDLDVKSRQYYRWGFLRWLWWPYQRVVSHRSPWSHGVVLGLLARLAYLSLALFVLGALALALVNTYWHPIRIDRMPALAAPLGRTDRVVLGAGLAGVWLGGALHTWADGLTSAFRRWVGSNRIGRRRG